MARFLSTLAVLVFLASGNSAFGQLDCFDFTGGMSSPHHTDLNEVLSGTTTAGSTTITMTAVSTVGIPELDFDATDGIGVNITANMADENDKLDAAVGDESIEIQVDAATTLEDVLIDGMGWGTSNDYEYCDVFVNDAYVATLLDTDADATTAALHANPIIGAASDTFLGLGIDLQAGDVLKLSYFEVGSNNGWRLEKLAFATAQTEVTVVADSFELQRGTLATGDVPELSASDNSDVTIFRRTSDIQAVTQFVVKTTSPFDNPSAIDVTLEGSVFARSAVTQRIEAFDYANQSWVEVASGPAARFNDTTVTEAATGGDFVEDGTLCMQLRISYISANPRQQFTSNTDFVAWTIFP